MTQLRRIAMVVSLVICANQVLAQDWKAQPNPQVTGQVGMNLLSDTGCRILNGFSGETDGGRWGVLATYEVITPAFSRAVFYAHATKAKAWPNMRNQGYPYIVTNDKKSMAELRDGVVFFILELQQGGYLAVTAMPGPKTESWLHTDKEGRLLLSFGTFGTDGVKNCHVPLFAWARSDDIYEACSKAISSAISSKPILGWTQLQLAQPPQFLQLQIQQRRALQHGLRQKQPLFRKATLVSVIRQHPVDWSISLVRP